MGNTIVVLIIVTTVGLAVVKLRKDKKNGVKCPGCNHSADCPSNYKECN